MKTRIVGSLILLLVLFGLFVVSGGNTGIDTKANESSTVIVPSSNDATMKSLSIN